MVPSAARSRISIEPCFYGLGNVRGPLLASPHVQKLPFWTRHFFFSVLQEAFQAIYPDACWLHLGRMQAFLPGKKGAWKVQPNRGHVHDRARHEHRFLLIKFPLYYSGTGMAALLATEMHV